MIGRILIKAIIRARKMYEEKERKFINQQLINRIVNSGGKIGKGCKFGKNVVISGCNNIQLGDNVHIGSGCFIRAEGGVVIRDNTIISRNCVIY